MQDTILGLEIGTTSTKAVLFDLSGQELAVVQQSYPLLTPQAGWAEQDPERLWTTVVQVLRDMAKQLGPARRILALALAAQSGSLIPVKADGEPSYPMITWLDSRTETLVKQWQAAGVEETVRRLSGWRLHPGLPLSTIAWLRQHRPDVFKITGRFLGVHDFLVHRLTGHFCAELSGAAEMQLVEAATGRWSEPLCALAGITPDRLAELKPAGAVIGTITPQVSRLTGLAAETPVVSGGHDQCCTALAMGMTAPGKLMLATGTAWVITGITASPAVEAVPASMDLNFHVVPERWTVSQLLGGFGAAVEWWLNQNLQSTTAPLSRAELYRRLDQVLAGSEPGSKHLLFLPPGGRAQLPGSSQAGGFIGLRLDHSRADMSRAILEGIAFEVRWALETMRQMELPVTQVWLAGGATQSPIWPQILADATGAPLLLTRYAHWPALGAAILAGFGAGVFDTLGAGIDRFRRSPQEIGPAGGRRQGYDEQFAAYQRLARLLAETDLKIDS